MQQINHYITLMLFALNRCGKWIPHNLETEYHTNAIMNTWLVMDLLCCDFKIHNICYVITDCLPVLSGDKSWGLASSLVQFCIRELALWLLQWDKNDLIIYLTLIEFPEFLQFTVHLIPPSHHNSSVNVIWITCSFQGGVCQSCPSTPWCIVPFHWEILRSFPSFCMTEALLSIPIWMSNSLSNFYKHKKLSLYNWGCGLSIIIIRTVYRKLTVSEHLHKCLLS